MSGNALLRITCWLITAISAETSPITVQGTPSATRSGGAEASVHYLFGDRDIEFALEVQGIVGARFDLAARLLQKSLSLEVPVGEPLGIEANVVLDATARHCSTAAIRLPAVKRPSPFRLEFLVREHATEAWRPAGEVLLMLYPADLLADLRSYADDQVIAVDDPGGKLTSLFAKHKIRFVAVEHLPATRPKPAKTGYQGVGQSIRRPDLALLVASDDLERTSGPGSRSDRADVLLSRGYRVVCFEEREETVPYVRIRSINEGMRLDVEMRLLDSVKHDPRSQATLLEIIHLAMSEDGPQ